MTNYTKSEILNNIPRHLKTQPGAPRTHLAYITDDEAKMLQKKKPGTPHGTRSGIPSYDYQTESGGWVSSGDAHDFGGYTGAVNNNPWSGNDWVNEFANTPTVIQESEDDYYEDDSYWDAPVGTDPPINYVPWQDSAVDKFVSAFGGLTYDWVDPNSAFLTEDIYGNPLPDHGEHWYTGGGLWNPFYAGEDPKGNPIWLNEGQFNEMMSVGEFGILPPVGTTTGGGPGPRGGGGGRGGGYYRSGSGGGGGGGGGSRMQFPGAGGDAYMRGRWGQPTIQGDYIRRMRGYNRGGIVSLC